ncbi:DNA-processing protein DprA [uncultured Thiodictyon sp.]|uniref:DNA-processing protein DprA n=1 Tax=uncultured Thiodictyon sp. TaxID=1846217 RepID=UPI0025DCE502|nr:DNA-processing protein DprA [uncultured Thiodictyon sp.]
MSSLDAWLALAGAPGIGPRTCARLIERFGSPQGVLDAAPSALGELGLKPAAISALKRPDRAWSDAVLGWAARPDAHVLTLDDPRYPPLLRQLADPPTLLYVRGEPGLLADPQVAIVGSRNPSVTGREITREFARRLAACGLIVTSGLATGVDGEAHTGALETGKTIAVLGTGPDRVYPAGHRDLARRIAGQGALVSEFAPGEGPLAHHFPRRNRLIAGLSLGTLVTEAALRSGSLITARQAGEQGREVFAVPGSIRNPLARGCHALIREGAALVEDAAEVLAALAPQLRGQLGALTAATGEVQTSASWPDPDYDRLLAALGFDPVAPDELTRCTGLSAAAVSSMLLVLELGGHVSSCPGGRYCRART